MEDDLNGFDDENGNGYSHSRWKRPQGPRRRWEDSHVSFDKAVSVTATILSIVALIFALGVNYQKMAAVDERLSTFIEQVETSYVRRDVQSEQIKLLTEQVTELRGQVEMLRMERGLPATSTNVPGGPRFGR